MVCFVSTEIELTRMYLPFTIWTSIQAVSNHAAHNSIISLTWSLVVRCMCSSSSFQQKRSEYFSLSLPKYSTSLNERDLESEVTRFQPFLILDHLPKAEKSQSIPQNLMMSSIGHLFVDYLFIVRQVFGFCGQQAAG